LRNINQSIGLSLYTNIPSILCGSYVKYIAWWSAQIWGSFKNNFIFLLNVKNVQRQWRSSSHNTKLVYNNYTNIYNNKKPKNTKWSRNYRIRLVVSKPGTKLTKSRFTKQHEFSPFVHFTFDAFFPLSTVSSSSRVSSLYRQYHPVY
jgi:hypothetical protein